MHPFAMVAAAILVHKLNRLSLCTKMQLRSFCYVVTSYAIELNFFHGHHDDDDCNDDFGRP